MPADQVVGVVIPARNAERWLASALESVLVQGHRPLDIVVVDDGSEDGTAAVAELSGPPVRVVRARRGGVGAARNQGVEAVGGDMLAFLDADDLWTPSRLSEPLVLLGRRPEVEVVFGHVRSFCATVDGAPQGLDAARPAHLPSAMLIRRAAFDRVGAFREGVIMGESLDWLLRAREAGLREATLDEQVLWRRVHDRNTTLRHRSAQREYVRALKASLDRRRLAR